MSDTAQSSVVALAKPSTSPSKLSASSGSDVYRGKSPDNSFSRELARASDQSDVKGNISTRSADDKVVHGEKEQTDRARSSRNADREGRADSETNQPDKVQQSTTSSAKEATSQSEDVTSQSKEAASQTDNADQSADQPVEENDSNSVAFDKASTENTDVDDVKAAPMYAIDSKILKSVNTERSPDTSLVNGGTVESEALDIVVPVREEGAANDVVVSDFEKSASVEHTADLDAVQLQFDNSAVQDQVAVTSGIEADATSPGTTIAAASGVAGKTAILPGEQISSAALASRQAHLVGLPAPRQGNTATLVQDADLAADPDIEPEISRVTGSNVSTVALSPIKFIQAGDGATQQVISLSQQLTPPSLESRVATAQGVTEQLALEEDLKTADLKADLKATDLKTAAELDAKLAARTIDQQVSQTNLAQSQLQARQQVAQAFINPITNIATGDTAEPDKLSADNMFLSSAGGILTAPVLQRADAGSTQAITAPLNMPILQGDSEKAMAGNIRWMVNEGVKNAVINVTPSGMGPISVRVGKEKDHINVSIIALQGSTREALDSMLPRLREQFAAQGHNSVNVDISDGRSGQSDRGYGQHESAERHAMENQSRSSSHSTDSTQDDLLSESQVKGVAGIATELITVDSNGQVRSRYDAYV